jgi:MSHA biogenesis protein MshI
MRWPWKRQSSSERLVVSWTGQVLSYVLARAGSDGAYEVLKFGVERQGAVSTEDFVHRLNDFGLKGLETHVMLWPEQYQWLQIDAPPVAPEELRSAARYQIREMLNTHVDDVTLDVMRVGDGSHKGAGHLFVVAAPNAEVRRVLDLGDAMHWTVSVIDVQETAQRNLQSALVRRDGQADRANAALVLEEGHQAVLTISANEELFYTRRFDLPVGFLTASWGQESAAAEPEVPVNAYTPVDDYVPDYSVGGVSYGNDYSDMRGVSPGSVVGGAAQDDQAQRLLVEVQRSLDVWDRSWSSMPLNGLRVYAGVRSAELSKWLSVQLGQTVKPLDVNALFAGFEGGAEGDQALCAPLLGVLMRSERRKL